MKKKVVQWILNLLFSFADACELMLLPYLTHGIMCDPTIGASDRETAYISVVVFFGMLIGAFSSGVAFIFSYL